MLFFGALFAALEKRGEGRLSVFSSRFFWHGLAFTSVFNVAVLYALIRYPDWMWMYYLENGQNSLSEIIYIFVFLYYLPYVLGFYLGRLTWQKGFTNWALLTLVWVAAEAWIVAHLFNRYAVIGTTAEFQAGTAVSLFSPQNPIGPVMNGSVVAMIVYYGILLWKKKGKDKACDTR